MKIKKLNKYPISFLRSSIFKPTKSLEVKYLKKSRKIYEDSKYIIKSNAVLSQRHKDLLLILSKLPLLPRGDTYVIPLTIYQIAKMLGYKNPNSVLIKVKELIQDLSKVSLEISDIENKLGVDFTIFQSLVRDEENNRYILVLNPFFAEYIFSSICVIFNNEEIVNKIVSIENPNLKAFVTLVYTNKQDFKMNIKDIVEKMELKGMQKTRFLKALRENKEFLKNEFQIEYNEEEGIVILLDKQVEFYYPQKKQNLLTNLATLKDKKENQGSEIISNHDTDSKDIIQENKTLEVENKNKENKLNEFIGLTINLIGEEVQVIDIENNTLVALKKDGSQIFQTFPNKQVLINFLKRFKGDSNE